MAAFRRVRERLSKMGRERGRSQRRTCVSTVPGHDRAVRFFLSALVALSIVAVCIENGLHPVFLLLVPLVIVALLRRNYRRPLICSERILTALLTVYVVLCSAFLIYTYGRLSAPLFLVYFTVGIVVARALLPLTDRNVSQLILLSIGLVLINCILTNNMLFCVTLVLYLFCLIGTLLHFDLARSRAVSAEVIAGSSVGPYPKGWHVSIAKYGLVTLGLAGVLFVVVPRPFALFPGLTGGIPGRGADLRRQISYRDIANMAGLHRIAFRVRFDQAPLPSIRYWRGSVLDQTDGSNWSASERVRLGYVVVRANPGEVFSYTVFPYRLQTSIVYACGMPVQALGRGRKPLLINARREVVVDSVFLVSESYEVHAVHRPIPISSRDVDYADATQVPPRIKDLALSWTRGATTPRQKAEALLMRFKTGFTYELRVPQAPQNINPLEYFLFQTRTGNCEYFAGAMGLMLRAVDVPSRLVEGFLGMEEAGVPTEFVIRFSHAHAWVEALLEPSEWTTLDPTPPGAFKLPHRVWLWLTDFYDNVEFEWLRSVVNFDRSDQLMLLQGLSRFLSSEFRSPLSAFPQVASGYLAIAVAAFVALSAALIARRAFLRGKSPSAIYVNTMRALVRKGVLDRVYQWHEQNAQEIVRNAPSTGKALAAFMDAYLRARFDEREKDSTATLRHVRRKLLEEADQTNSLSHL